MQKTKRLEYVPDPNKFDLQTHRWDSQGNLVAKNPYRNHIINGNSYYERPVNSGNLWFENNQPAGRMELEFGEDGKISKKTLRLDAKHVDYTAPLKGDAAIHYELEQTRNKNAQLEAELAAIKGESAKKAAPAPAPVKPSPLAEIVSETVAAPTLTKRV